MDEPRYGKRSPDWRPEPAETTPAHNEAGDAELRRTSTPWPTMGELGNAAGTTSHRALGTLPGDARHRAADSASRSSAPGTTSAMSGPPSAAQMQGSLAGPDHTLVERERAQRDSLRRRGRHYVVWGLVLAFLVSPIVTIGYLFVAADLVGLAGRMAPVASGDTVSVDTSGGYMVMAPGSGGVNGCTLTNPSGQAHQMEPIPGNQPSYWIAHLPAGPYTIDCEVTDQTTLMGATGINPSQMNTDAARGLLAGTVTGFVGITMAVIGARRVGRSRR